MKDLLIGMGLGFIVGAVAVKSNKMLSNKIDKGVEKGKEVIEDIGNEIKSQTQKFKKEESLSD